MFKILKRWKKPLLWFLCIFFLYLGFLYYQITSKFEKHRWALPSRVYSDSFPLFMGSPLSKQALTEKLEHLNYHRVGHRPTKHGQYRESSNYFEIYLHSFDYPHQKFAGFPISIALENNATVELKNLETDTTLPFTRLEPELVGSIFDEHLEDRTFVPLEKIPKNLIEAVLAIEDERFYSHVGIDPLGIARAFLTNLSSGKLKQGGSTLTQQLVKNYFLSSRRSWVRKFNEAWMALLMELRYSKEEILESYLNEIYFGQRGTASVMGVAEASRFFFSKEISQITLGESALLAGMIRSPGRYSPFMHAKRAQERRDFVLKRLFERKIVSKSELEKALAEKLPVKNLSRYDVVAHHFIEFLKNQIQQDFPLSKLQSEGLRIFTTLEMNLQRQAQKSVGQHLTALEKGYRSLQKNKEEGAHLEAAFVAIQPGTGFLRAYVGGRNYETIQFDHVSQAHRQPGSVIKPFVYLSAIDPDVNPMPFHLSSLLQDEPLKLKVAGKTWSPENYNHKFHGSVRLRQALENSFNVATVWLSQEVGLNAIIQTLKKVGLGENLKAYPSLVLGTHEVTPLQLLLAYTIFPNQGDLSEPVAVRSIVTPEGEVLQKKDIALKPLFNPDAIYLMNKALGGVLLHGTGASARRLGFEGLAAGKTGTTSDARDAWFIGYTPDLLALAWVGYDDNRKVGLAGSQAALPIWVSFMKKATLGLSYQDFTPTDHIVMLKIDSKTGLLYSSNCGEPIEEYFIQGFEPQGYCDEPVLPY